MVGVVWEAVRKKAGAGSEARFTNDVRPRGPSGAVSAKEDNFRAQPPAVTSSAVTQASYVSALTSIT